MSRFGISMLNAFAFIIIGLLILIQTDVDGSALISGWAGLRIAAILCLIGAFVSFFSALIHCQDDIIEDLYN